MCIMCLTPNTWKIPNGKAQSVIQMTCAVLRLSIHESASKVNRSGADAQVFSYHGYLVFHPFAEQLTAFFRISLDLFWHRLQSSESSTSASITCNGIMSVLCRKLCINPYIVNLLQTYIHACIHTYKHAYIHTYIHTYMYIHTYIHT